MDPITFGISQGAAGAAGGDPLYVDDVFSTYVYEGTGSERSINNGIDLSGKGGLVWTKRRAGTIRSHALYDSERGAAARLETNTAGAAENQAYSITMNSDGYTWSSGVGQGDVNGNGDEYVSWTFRKAPGFFDVVTWTGDGVNGRQISHSLGSTPGVIIIKRTSTGTENWVVYHRSLGTGQYLTLNENFAANSFAYVTALNSNTFSVSNQFQTNGSGETYVAYLFAHDDQSFGTNGDESIIKCGSYTGTGSDPVITLGWEPQWLLIKPASTTGNWQLYDVMRGMPVGGDESRLYPNLTNAEESLDNAIELTSTGFIPRSSATDASGVDYIYIAIRRPHKPPTAATEVFNTVTYTGDGTSDRLIDSGITTDLLWTKGRTTAFNGWFSSVDRMRGSDYELRTNGTGAEVSFNYFANFDQQTGVEVMDVNENYNDNGEPTLNYHFRRAPGFFDVVAYTGTGSATTVSHNLDVVPELIVLKNRSDGTRNWSVYSAALGASAYLNLNSTNASSSTSTHWDNTGPTTTVFTVGTRFDTNDSGDSYIAYLFASLDGISKVGSYAGTGSNIDVDCGFTAGARFVLIKRTDSTGDWYVWDTERGIVSGNDPYLLINSDAAEVTTTDYIDPLNAGFTVTSSAPAALNFNGGTYIFLAIA